MLTPAILSKLSDKELTDIAEYQKQLFLEDMANKGHFRKYVDIPSAPTLSSPITIVPGDIHVPSQSFLNTLHGMTAHVGNDIKTSGLFTSGFRLNDYTPASGTYRFVNTAGDVLGSGSYNNHAVQTATDGDKLYFYGLDPANPYLVRTDPNPAVGLNGFAFYARVGGATYYVQNAVIDSVGNSGLSFNSAVGGGATYASVNVNNVRVFNCGQEGIYVGNFGNTPDVIDNLNINDFFVYNSQREGIQCKAVTNGAIYKCTVIKAGQGGVGGQNHALQLEDYNGYVKKCIFYQAQRPFNIFAHGITLEDLYFEFDTAFGYIGRTDNLGWASSPRLNGQPITLNRCYFKWTGAGTLSRFCQVALRDANVTFTNCTFNGITDIIDDQRAAGFTNTLSGSIGSGGNVSAAITSPTFLANYNLYSDYTHHGLLDASSPYYPLRFGYRVPG